MKHTDDSQGQDNFLEMRFIYSTYVRICYTCHIFCFWRADPSGPGSPQSRSF